MAKRRDHERNKMVTLRVNKDYGFDPVKTDLADDGLAAVDGKSISRCRCRECGKLYKWNSVAWMTRHWMGHGHSFRKLPGGGRDL